MQLDVLLSYLTPAESVYTPGSCRCLFYGSFSSQEYSPFSPHIPQSRCPHPISQAPIPSPSGAWHCWEWTVSAALLLLLWSPGAGPPAAEDESLLIGCQRGNSQPTPLSLNYYVPHISQTSHTFLYTPVHFLPLVCHPSSPPVKILTLVLLPLARDNLLLQLPPGPGSSLLAGHQVIQI